jgi:heavy metal translocating P-type ATPase
MTTIDQTDHCEHCGEKIVVPSVLKLEDSEKLFCCNGCKTVYQILHEKGLDNYYKLRDETGSRDQLSPVSETNEKYHYLDQKEFIDKYARQTNETITIDFFIEGVHCVACLWLIEKLPDFVDEVIFSKLNMSKSIATVTISKEGKLSSVAHQLALLGYKPHPILNDEDVETLARSEDRKMLIKIAVAFTCAGNIMLLSFSIYGGAEGPLAEQFKWYSMFLFFPTIFYSAIPFYQSAWSALKAKKISIDIPIVVAILMGTISGIINTFKDAEHIYFDSLATLVFLLLGARYLLKKSQQKSLNTTEIASFFSNRTAHKLKENNTDYEDVHAQFLQPKDIILVKPGEMVPADGLVLEGNSNVNNSLLTGESLPVKMEKTNYIYSGTTNLDSDLKIQVLNTKEDTRLGKILKSVEAGWNQKAEIVTFADNVAKYFVSIVFGLAFITFLWILLAQNNFEAAFTRALTLIIITCPCALGLTTPLALTITLGRLAKKGMIIKNEQIIEKLSKAKRIFLDKTGTLTHGSFKISEWNEKDVPDDIKAIAYHLEDRSEHPMAKAITSYIKSIYFQEGTQIPTLSIQNYVEHAGKGVSGEINGIHYTIKSIYKDDPSKTWVGLYKNAEVICELSLEDKLRPDAYEAIANLNKLRLSPHLISGDSQGPVTRAAKELGIAEQFFQYQVTPEQKSEIIKVHPEAIMVGDGANDAIALSQAYVGIAVHGSVDISLRAADVYLSQSGVRPILDVVVASKETMKVIRRNLIFSLIYNVLGATLAILGYITPLLAAILMPISSFTVLLSTIISTKKLNKIMYQK